MGFPCLMRGSERTFTCLSLSPARPRAHLSACCLSVCTGVVLAPAKVVSRGGNPWGAVLYSWALVQVSLPPQAALTSAPPVTLLGLGRVGRACGETCPRRQRTPSLSVLIQLVLLAGKLNTLAAVVTVFYLVAYAAVDLSCLSLEWASAPNFR